MNNKYYIPDISEFHVGFECEYFNNFSKQFIPTIIDETNYNNPELGYDEDYLFSYRDENKFRVKYLDKKDIEDLGFVFRGGTPYDTRDLYFQKEDIKLILIFQTEKLLVLKETGRELLQEIDATLFNGKIKNKSELVKLLKQLNINNG